MIQLGRNGRIARERVVPGALQHGGELDPQLRDGPAERILGDRLVEHDARIFPCRGVMIERVVLETIKPQGFGLGFPHLANHPDRDAMMGVIATTAPFVLAMGSTAVSLMIPERKANGLQLILGMADCIFCLLSSY
jgi:hypothetical protein